MHGVLLDRHSLDRNDIDFTALQATLPQWEIHAATAAHETIARIGAAQVVVSNKVVLDEDVLAQAPNIKLIAVAATGTNNVDLAAAAARGITVCNVTRYATPSVVQHVFALLLSLTRRLDAWQGAVHRGDWNRSADFCLLDFPMRELGGLTLGIVGYGELGQAVARVAEQAFGMRVLLAARPGSAPQPGRLALNELLPQVDVLTLHCPLSPETRNLIGAAELALMKPDALLINTARGGIVDEAALAAALRSGRLGGAGIDVLATEPPRAGNVLFADDIPNLIVTPHVAWASREARQRLIDQVGENIRAFSAGTPRNVVTP